MPYIVTVVAVILAAIFALLVKFWAGFVYFVLAVLLLLSLFWGAWLIYKYLTEFKAEIQERYKFYKAEKINKSHMDIGSYENNEMAYKKDFSRKILKDKISKWFVILFCFAVAVAFLLGMIFYK